MSRNFFTEINYSSANEDGRIERAALAGGLEGGSALCITGSGARPLELLIAAPERVVAIDFNPAQNFLLELKMRAMREMDYEDFLAFIGVAENSDRDKTYRALRSRLGAPCRAFWDRRSAMVRNGVIYCGRWEGYLSRMAAYYDFFKRGRARAFLNCQDLAAQNGLWRAETDRLGWRILMRLAGLRAVWKYIAREPGIDLIPRRVDIANLLKRRMDRAAAYLLFRDCSFAWLLFTGRFNPDTALPCHLERRHYAAIKERLDCISVVTDSLAAHLNAAPKQYSAFSVSDFGSYAPKPEYAAVWQGMLHAATAGARVCERLFLVPRSPQRLSNSRLIRDNSAEKQAARQDRSFVYEFVIGRIE